MRIRDGGSARRAARVLAAIGAAWLALAGVARAEVRIAVVDLQRALNECDAGKKAKDQVKAKFEKAQLELKKEREDLDKARDEFEKKAILLKDDERRNRERELENRTLDFKRKYEDMQRDLKRTDGELTSGIIEQLYGIVADYGKQQGYTVVLEASSGLLYADKALDITDAVVKIQNSGGAPKAAKPPAGGAATPPLPSLPTLPVPKE
jgi:outer membrane protein